VTIPFIAAGVSGTVPGVTTTGGVAVGVFEKVMLAIAILVANGVLLFVILRFLLWLAFPGKRDGEDAVVAVPRAAGGALAAPAGAGGAVPIAAAMATAAPAERSDPPAASGMPVLATPLGRPRAYPHRLLIGLPVILALFAGGVWLGSVVGGSGSAAAATHTIHVKGRVITVNHRTVVRVPGQIVVVKKGSVISVPETTVPLPAHVVTHVIKRTITTVLPGKTSTVVTTVVIPTTVFDTGTTTTVTETTTETVTSATSTTSTSATT
jgi:hypothetical protein